MMDSRQRRLWALTAIAGLVTGAVQAQQIPDKSFEAAIQKPAHSPGGRPLVLVDEAHYNFHTVGGLYLPFADLLRRDGYSVEASSSAFTPEGLSDAQLLVISNALAKENRDEETWTLPTPSAFSQEEIAAVRDWVRNGGALLLIADHMPFPGAAGKLAAAFGFRFSNGFAAVGEKRDGQLTFRRTDGSLAEHPIRSGRSVTERIDSVTSFVGSAFEAGRNAKPVLILPPTAVSLLPNAAWEKGPQVRFVPAAGWTQGATLRFGKGRVAIFGEAAMFTAQLVGPDRTPVGMNSIEGNPQFVLNVMHWLSGLLDD